MLFVTVIPLALLWNLHAERLPLIHGSLDKLSSRAHHMYVVFLFFFKKSVHMPDVHFVRVCAVRAARVRSQEAWH